jgi:hypothetical protein
VSKEALERQIRTSIVNPRWAHRQNIGDRIQGLTSRGLGTITIFGASPRDGKAQAVRITPFHFLEARGLSPRGQEKFIAEINRCMQASRCAVIRSVVPVQTGSRRKR